MKIKLIASDIDNTLIISGKKNPDTLKNKFQALLEKNQLLLAYFSGRPLQEIHCSSMYEQLPTPNFICSDLGTYLYKISEKKPILVSEWEHYKNEMLLKEKWADIYNLLINHKISSLEKQDAIYQTPTKLSYFSKRGMVEENITLIKSIIGNKPYDIIITDTKDHNIVYFDIMPNFINKGTALRFLCDLIKINNSEMIFCGDSENDLTAFSFANQIILSPLTKKEIHEKLNYQAKDKNIFYSEKCNSTPLDSILEALNSQYLTDTFSV